MMKQQLLNETNRQKKLMENRSLHSMDSIQIYSSLLVVKALFVFVVVVYSICFTWLDTCMRFDVWHRQLYSKVCPGSTTACSLILCIPDLEI